MELGIRGQLAVVIGAARGIGRAIAEAFATEGCPLALLDVDTEVEVSARDMAARHSLPARSYVVDATDFAALSKCAEHVQRELGGVRHLVLALGCGSGRYGFPFWNLSPGDWERVVRVNLLAPVNGAHAFVPHMLDAGSGTLLFLSSIAAQIGSQTDPPYSAAKAGILNFAQCAAKDLAAYNIRVNTICPGMIKTALNRSVWQAWYDQQPPSQRLEYEPWAAAKIRRVTPLGRWQEPEEVAALAVFLASDRARSITGQTLNVDGGQVMHW